MKIFPERTLIVELPEVCGARLSADEVLLALEGNGMDPAVRSLVQLLVMTRADYITGAQATAQRGGNATFDLGGAQAIEDLLADVLGLIDGRAGDDVKRFFGG